MNICDLMLNSAKSKTQNLKLQAPSLRRQIAGNLDNPYDLECIDNRDIKLYCETYKHLHNTDPPATDINLLGFFRAEDNLLCLSKL